MALEVWWNSDEGPSRIASPNELVALLNRGSSEVDFPIMFEVLDADDPYNGSVLDVGVSGEHGALYFTGPEAEHGCFSYNKPSTAESDLAKAIWFDHMNHRRDFPPASLYPIDVVHRAVVEFVESNGSRPNAVEWQPASAMSAESEPQ